MAGDFPSLIFMFQRSQHNFTAVRPSCSLQSTRHWYFSVASACVAAGTARIENTVSCSTYIDYVAWHGGFHCCVTVYCTTVYQLACLETFLSNGCLNWFRSPDFQHICHNIKLLYPSKPVGIFPSKPGSVAQSMHIRSVTDWRYCTFITSVSQLVCIGRLITINSSVGVVLATQFS
jgi:hypothetical protein